MFPVFPVLFQVCSQSGPMKSLCSLCSGFSPTTLMDAVPVSRYVQQPGTLGTRFKRHELGSAHTWNRRGTLGTKAAEGNPICFSRTHTRDDCCSIRRCLSGLLPHSGSANPPAASRVYHDNSASPLGRDIAGNERRPGTNNYRLCQRQGPLSANHPDSTATQPAEAAIGTIPSGPSPEV
jgi:hypothetical protein